MKSEPMNNDLIAKDISYIQRDMGEIKTSIKELAAMYITKIQFDETVKTLQSSLQTLEAQIEERNKRDGSSLRFVLPTMMAILGSVITFLLISYLQGK